MSIMGNKKLNKDHFIALRSLERASWIKGWKVIWRFNRQWRDVPADETPALKVVDSLIAMGLVADTTHCGGCNQPAFRLTEKGRLFVRQMNGEQQVEQAKLIVEPEPTSWIDRFWSAFASWRRSTK